MKYIIYAIAALVGFHLCWLAAYWTEPVKTDKDKKTPPMV